MFQEFNQQEETLDISKHLTPILQEAAIVQLAKLSEPPNHWQVYHNLNYI